MELFSELNAVVGAGHTERGRCVVRVRTSPKGHLGTSMPGRGKGESKRLCYSLNICVPPNPYIEAVIPNSMVFEGEAFGR